MRQITLSTARVERYNKTTRRATVVGEMERVVAGAMRRDRAGCPLGQADAIGDLVASNTS